MPDDSPSESDDERSKAPPSDIDLTKRTPKATGTESAAAKRERLANLAELTKATEFAPKGTGSR